MTPRAISDLDHTVLQAGRLVVACDAGLLARYGRFDLVERWRDDLTRTTPQGAEPLRGLLLLVPSSDRDHAPILDGTPVPVVTAGRGTRVPSSWLERVGAAFVYSLNREHLLAGHVMGIAEAKTHFIAAVRAQVAAWTVPCVFAAMFGSAARGDMGVGSDVDVLLVRPRVVDSDEVIWDEQTAELARRITRMTGNDARLLELTEAAVAAGSARDLISDVRRDGIHIAGDATIVLRRSVA